MTKWYFKSGGKNLPYIKTNFTKIQRGISIKKKMNKKYQQFTKKEIQRALKYRKRHSKEMKNKNTVRYHFSATGLAKIKALRTDYIGELASHLPSLLSNPFPTPSCLADFTMYPTTQKHQAGWSAGSSTVVWLEDHTLHGWDTVLTGCSIHVGPVTCILHPVWFLPWLESTWPGAKG